MTPDINLQAAIEAATKAVELIKMYQNEGFSVHQKAKNDLVTKADINSEKLIIEHLLSCFPDDLILAEESGGILELSGERTWIIDPIDGTTNFVHGFPVWCVSIALWEYKKPVAAVVLEGGANQLFCASRKKGAWLNGSPIHVSSVDSPANALIGTGFPYRDLELMEPYLNLFRQLMAETHGVRRPGSAAYDLCCVAAGRFDGFYEYGLNPWDVAAGGLIVEEAGGLVSDWENGNNWLMGKRIVAGNPKIHKFLLQSINRYFSV